jgi:hypothetical protein
MNNDIGKYNKIIQENEELKIKNKILEEKLKSYTNTDRHKEYYNKNSDIIKEKAKKYTEKIKITNPDKIKQYRHTAYLKRKEKLLKLNNDNL